MLQEELAAGDKKKLVEEVAGLKAQGERDRKAWDAEKKKLEGEVKRLKLSVLGSEKKLAAKQVELDEAIAAKNAAAEEAASEIDGLQQAIYSEHVNGFQKALRQAEFLYREVSVTDCRFNVNLDVYDNRMLDVAEIGRLKAAFEADVVGEEGTLATTPPNVEIEVPGEDGGDEEGAGEELLGGAECDEGAANEGD